MVGGWICIDKPVRGMIPSIVLSRPFATGAAVRDGNNQNWVQNQLNRCFSTNLEVSQSMGSCSALINTPQVRGKQLAAAFSQRGFLQREKDPDRAIVDYDNALKAQPDSADALAGRAWIRMAGRDYDAALRDLNKAVDLAPTMAKARYYRGYAYLRLENFRHALTDLNEAIRLEPNHADYYLARGETWEALENHEAALHDFGEFGKLAPQDVRGLLSSGAVLEAMGKPAEALAAFEQAVSLAPNDNYAVSERDRLRSEGSGAAPAGERDDAPR